MKTEIFWNILVKFWNLMKILKSYENFEILCNFEFLNFKIFYFFSILEFWNFLKICEIFKVSEIFVWSFEICCPMKKRFKGQFNSLSCNSLLKTIDASIDHRGAKNAKNILKYVHVVT